MSSIIETYRNSIARKRTEVTKLLADKVCQPCVYRCEQGYSDGTFGIITPIS